MNDYDYPDAMTGKTFAQALMAVLSMRLADSPPPTPPGPRGQVTAPVMGPACEIAATKCGTCGCRIGLSAYRMQFTNSELGSSLHHLECPTPRECSGR